MLLRLQCIRRLECLNKGGEEHTHTMELYELQQCVELALELIERRPKIVVAEVYAAWEEQQIVPMQHHTAEPEAAVPLPHVQTSCGLSILVELADGSGSQVGFASEDVEFSYDSVANILESAIYGALPGSLGYPLPGPVSRPASLASLYDPELLSLPENEIVHMANEALEGVLTTYKEAGYSRDVRVSGEVRSHASHLVVGNTQGLLAHDTLTGLIAAVQTWLTAEDCWGSSSRGTAYSNDFSAYDAGAEAAQQALQMRGAMAMAAGDYPVIFGPQAVAALLYDLWVPACSLDTVAREASPLAKLYGQSVVSPLLSLIDDARLPGMLGSRIITDEGIPTGKTTLIERGRLSNFLADVYQAHRYTNSFGSIAPRNGLRCAIHGRSFTMRPGIFPTNLVLVGSDTVPLEELLAPITKGIYVGNLWSTTAHHGLSSGAFTSTVIGPSFGIEHGKLSHPIKPGVLQLQDNFLELLQRCTGVSADQQVVVLSTRQSVVVSPELRCSVAHFV